MDEVLTCHDPPGSFAAKFETCKVVSLRAFVCEITERFPVLLVSKGKGKVMMLLKTMVTTKEEHCSIVCRPVRWC